MTDEKTDAKTIIGKDTSSPTGRPKDTTVVKRMRRYREHRRHEIRTVLVRLHVTEIEALGRAGYMKLEQRPAVKDIGQAVAGLVVDWTMNQCRPAPVDDQ